MASGAHLMAAGASPALGAFPGPEGTRFALWSSVARKAEVRLFADARRVRETLPLRNLGGGLHELVVREAGPGTLYRFVLDGAELADPYARFLPYGVDGPAEVIAEAGPGEVSIQGPAPLSRLVIYELHIGTFTAAGTYRSAIERLPALADVGVTAIEVMPLSSFPGTRGWGYDGVAHFAPYAPYGRPGELRELVRSAHRFGMTILLDVVYNHFGPHGNALGAYAPEYFVAEANTPWGAGPNFSHPQMRAFVLDNARYWLEQFGFDGLRLDATHEIHDPSQVDILWEMRQMTTSLAPPRLLIAEDDRNEPDLVLETGLDALWADDFHHQMRVLVAGDRDGYYAAYPPKLEALARTIEHGWTYEGQVYAPWGRPRGRPADGLSYEHLVYCIQNHDQIGNRAFGTRLSDDVSLPAVHLATTLLFFLPMVPLLFMGQEWSASSPFLFFSDHEGELGRAVSAGRRKEFARFKAFSSEALQRRIPDPQALSTFERSKLLWEERDQPAHRQTLDLVRSLTRLRRDDPVLAAPCRRGDLVARAEGKMLRVERRGAGQARVLLANFGSKALPLPAGKLGALLLASGPSPAGVLAGWTASIFAIDAD